MISEKDKCNYLHILESLNTKSEKMFTVVELCEFLEVSNKTIIEFRKGRIIKFDLLFQYASLIGDELMIELKSELRK